MTELCFVVDMTMRYTYQIEKYVKYKLTMNNKFIFFVELGQNVCMTSTWYNKCITAAAIFYAIHSIILKQPT